MEKKLSNSAEMLISRIAADAQKDAAAQMAEAQLAVDKIVTERDKRIAELKTRYARLREQQVQGVLDGSRTRAELDGRKEALADKRAVLEAVFAEAEVRVNALSGQKRDNLLMSLLRAEAVDGNTVVPAPADREALKRLIAKLPQKLSLSPQNAKIAGGFLLVGGSYEKDCSFDALLTELRGREEMNVSRILFSQSDRR